MGEQNSVGRELTNDAVRRVEEIVRFLQNDPSARLEPGNLGSATGALTAAPPTKFGNPHGNT